MNTQTRLRKVHMHYKKFLHSWSNFQFLHDTHCQECFVEWCRERQIFEAYHQLSETTMVNLQLQYMCFHLRHCHLNLRQS